MVSAWASENRIVLAQLAMEEKSNELTAIAALLRQLGLAGCIVTIDAMGTQIALASQIIEQAGDYALALKENQLTMYEGVSETFALALKDQFENLAVLRHLALHLLRHEKTARVGIKVKRLKAGWDTNYLQRILVAVI